MTARIEHRDASELTPAWLGLHVTVTTDLGTYAGGLSDYEVGPGVVALYLGGQKVEANANTTVTRGGLDVLGGAA